MEYESLFKAARQAGTLLAETETERLGRTLMHAAQLLRTHTPRLLEANARDLEAMAPDSPLRDRLRLTPERIAAIADDMEAVAHLPSPQGEELERRTRPNGMTIVKRRVPFGVVGMICEARPNVTADIFSLCIKTGNACVLKGGGDARHSNEAIAALLHEALRSETGAGIVHTYFDRDGDLAKGRAVVCNAKTRRVSVCNALDCLVVHRDRLTDLPELCAPLAAARVTVYADTEAFAALGGHYPADLLEHASEEHFGTEFLDYKLAVRTVASPEEALAHIARYSSRHSEAIITENKRTAAQFTRAVDAACVYVNVSTAFTDGGQFGFGAEVGISTQKLHARGPMGLPELTTYKYVVTGDGQIRES